MGGWISYFWPQRSAEYDTTPGLDDVEAESGLTYRQKKVIIEIWDLVKVNIKENGVEFFVRFFDEFPDNRKYFRAIQNLTAEELKKSKKLEAHATNVMYALSTVVDNLEDIGCLKELLITIGRNHIKRKLTPEHFEHVRISFIKFLQFKLGSRFTPYCQKAWEDTFKVINSIIVTGLQGRENE